VDKKEQLPHFARRDIEIHFERSLRFISKSDRKSPLNSSQKAIELFLFLRKNLKEKSNSLRF